MKTLELTTHQAKTHLSKYLTLVMQGTRVIIKRGREAVAVLSPIEENKQRSLQRPVFGTITSDKLKYAEDCFEPLGEKELDNWGL